MAKYAKIMNKRRALIMLIEFKVKNFASFKNETILSAETGERLRKYKGINTFEDGPVSLLKNLLILGPNGSGKTELLNALRTMDRIVERGGTASVTDQLPYNPFAFDPDETKGDTGFSIIIQVANKIYNYSFKYNADEITYEKLSLLSGDKEKIYFERKLQRFVKLPKSLEGLSSKLRKNALFLFLAQQNNDQNSANVYRWFREDLIYVTSEPIGIPQYLLGLIKNNDLKNELVSFLEFADFNIIDLEVEKVPLTINPDMKDFADKMNLPMSVNSLQLFTEHKVYDSSGKVVGKQKMPILAESTGTAQVCLIALLIIWAQVHKNNKTIIMDEFDNSLHHELASALITIFNSAENNNQFILTIHDLQLLDNNLRTDQIYLLDKDFKGISDLKSIFDFNDSRNIGRSDLSLAKRYLKGRYGAMPVIDVDGLMDVLKSTHQKLNGDTNESNKA